MAKRLWQSLIILFALSFFSSFASAQEVVLDQNLEIFLAAIFQPEIPLNGSIGSQSFTPARQFKAGCSNPTTACMRFSCGCLEGCECGIAQLNCGKQICVCNDPC